MAGNELLDRDRELRAVDALVAQAVEGEARLVLIEGAAGIGKTRLLGEARRRAEAAGMRALAARGSELEREFAFVVVRQLFEPALGASASAPWRARRRPQKRCSRRPPGPTPPTAHLPLLARAEIARPEPPLGFVHPLIREAVLHDLGPGERELGHARAARMLAYLAFAAGPAFDPASTAAVEARLALVRDALAPEDSGREYMNFAERSRDVAKFFGTQDAARLRALKARVDPDGTVVAIHPV